jgi:hypothetical protein
MHKRSVQVCHVPQSIGAGRVLCHNHVEHTVDMPCGLNGFRAWTDTEVPKGFVKCPCGYAGLPHYALRIHVKVIRTNPAWLTRRMTVSHDR